MGTVLIQGGQVIDPPTQTNAALDVLIDGDKIRDVGRVSESADQVINAQGKLVLPGLIDMHVHLREPGREDKETIASGAEAALRGGFTGVAAMANTDPPIDSEAMVTFVCERTRAHGLAHVFPVGAVTRGLKGEALADLAGMARAGAVAFSDDGMPVMNSGLMAAALRYSRMLNRPVISHAQDLTLTEGGVMNEGLIAQSLGLRGMPPEAEEIMVARDIALARATGGSLHIAHISTRRAVESVRQAKREGVLVTAEATPHHALLSDELLRDYDARCKMNPPLRTRDDVEAVVEGLSDGTIDAIASDHAPHTTAEKENILQSAPFGIVGLETTLGLVLTALVARDRLSLARAVALMTVGPARILGLEGKGRLIRGADADVTIVDPDLEWTVDPQNFASRGKSTPFSGLTLRGRAVTVVVSGQVINLPLT